MDDPNACNCQDKNVSLKKYILKFEIKIPVLQGVRYKDGDTFLVILRNKNWEIGKKYRPPLYTPPLYMKFRLIGIFEISV